MVASIYSRLQKNPSLPGNEGFFVLNFTNDFSILNFCLELRRKMYV